MAAGPPVASRATFIEEVPIDLLPTPDVIALLEGLAPSNLEVADITPLVDTTTPGLVMPVSVVLLRISEPGSVALLGMSGVE